MDDSAFTQFLSEQRSVLAESSILDADSFRRAPFDAACRRLADAYTAGTADQRSAIRELVEELGVQPLIGIQPDQIRHRIDGIVFRLALIYESMKDLRPDPDRAIARLDELCHAARAARIDINPHLMDVAAWSSDRQREGPGTMRSLLLARVDSTTVTRCPRCQRDYADRFPGCPYCGRDLAPRPFGVADSGPPDLYVTPPSEDDILIYLPMRQAIPFLLMAAAACVTVLASVFTLLSMWIAGLNTWHIWFLLGWAALVFVALRYFRFGELARKYLTPDGQLRVRFSWQQWLLLLLVVCAYGSLFWAVIEIVARIGR